MSQTQISLRRRVTPTTCSWAGTHALWQFEFADAVGVKAGQSVLDVGCGPGALTSVPVDRCSAAAVSACDPSPPFVAECARRHPGVDIRHGSAEAIPSTTTASTPLSPNWCCTSSPIPDGRGRTEAGCSVRAASSPPASGTQPSRWRCSGTSGTQPPKSTRLHLTTAGPCDSAARERSLRCFRRPDSSTWSRPGLDVTSTYANFDELWSGFMAGIGPAGAYCVRQPDTRRRAIRDALFARLDSPAGTFALAATARCAQARTPT